MGPMFSGESTSRSVDGTGLKSRGESGSKNGSINLGAQSRGTAQLCTLQAPTATRFNPGALYRRSFSLIYEIINDLEVPLDSWESGMRSNPGAVHIRKKYGARGESALETGELRGCSTERWSVDGTKPARLVRGREWVSRSFDRPLHRQAVVA